MKTIRQSDPSRRLLRFEKELAEAVIRVMREGKYILGPEVEKFESDFAYYTGAKYCVGVASGTDAITFALRALGVKSGDEVITVALTASATVQAIKLCGAIPRFVDVDPDTRCMEPRSLEAAINSRTGAILPVHLYGYPAPMHDIAAIAGRYGIPIVEDCAQAHGTVLRGMKVGTFGSAAAFSFYPTKNLGCLGDGGALVCSDPEIAARVRAFRSYGWEDASRVSRLVAGNSRLDEVQASILSVMLMHLDNGNAERRKIANAYRLRLSDLPIKLPMENEGAIYHQFAIECKRRDEFMAKLASKGISTAVHYTPPLHLQFAFSTRKNADLPVTERLAAELLSLPIQPEIVEPEIDFICNAIREWFFT